MNVLITGGAGYLGSPLAARLLAAHHSVRVVDALLFGGDSLLGVYSHSRFEFVRGDIRDVHVLERAAEGMDAVVHLAAMVGEPACTRHPQLTRTTNIDATRLLIEQAKRYGVSRFVFSSTCSNYGVTAPGTIADEQAPLNAVSLYGKTKTEAEYIVTGAATARFYPTVLRLATIFGLSPRMRFDLLLNQLVRDAVVHGRIVIFGPGAWRPFIHVLDAIAAIEAALVADAALVSGTVFNVGSNGANYQKANLGDLIARHIPSAEVHITGEEDPRDYRVAFDRFGQVLDYHTQRTVEDGIREMRDAMLRGVIGDPFDPRYDNVAGAVAPVCER